MTSTEKKIEKTSSVWLPILTFVVGTLFGAYAQWKTFGLENKKLNLDEVMKTTELRHEENEVYVKVIAVTDQYVKELGDYSKTQNTQTLAAMQDDTSQIALLKDDFITLETNWQHWRIEHRVRFQFGFDRLNLLPACRLT